MDATLTDPTREECEAASEVLSESLRQPDDGYLLSVAEDMLRAAARVRIRAQARVKLATEPVPEALVSDVLSGADLKARVCGCGHTAYWHGNPNGTGGCEDSPDCDCRRFVLACRTDKPFAVDRCVCAGDHCAGDHKYVAAVDPSFDRFGVASMGQLGAIISFEADIAGDQAFDRAVRA